jgi:hypothetical protein
MCKISCGFIGPIAFSIKIDKVAVNMVSEEKKYVAFFDILGFKSWVNTRGSKEVFNYVRGFMNLMARASMPLSVVNPDMSVDLKPSIISYITVSDSIIYYSKDDSYEAFSSMLRVCAEFMNVVICGPSRMIRGAIAHGDFYADPENHAYVGKALIDAYELEEKQVWLGLSLHDNVVDSDNFIRAQEDFPNLIVKSLVSLKDSEKKPFCLNWSDDSVIDASFNALRSLDYCLNFGISTLGDNQKEIEKLRSKINYTREFIEHYQQKEAQS